jgi:hypothetical protein
LLAFGVVSQSFSKPLPGDGGGCECVGCGTEKVFPTVVVLRMRLAHTMSGSGEFFGALMLMRVARASSVDSRPDGTTCCENSPGLRLSRRSCCRHGPRSCCARSQSKETPEFWCWHHLVAAVINCSSDLMLSFSLDSRCSSDDWLQLKKPLAFRHASVSFSSS